MKQRGAPGPSRPTESSEAAPVQGNPMRQLLLDFTQAPAPTFAYFAPGGNAELARALGAAVKGDLAERVIYMCAESGGGNTHLRKAFSSANRGLPRYEPPSEFTDPPAPTA